MQLTDLYLTIDKLDECQSIVQILEERLEQAAHQEDYAFGILNEVANVLRKHENLELATQFYKKALLCIKRHYKSEYLDQFCTSQILVNIATVQFLQQNLPEALKYNQHSLNVLHRTLSTSTSQAEQLLIYAEQGKVHMSLAQIYK